MPPDPKPKRLRARRNAVPGEGYLPREGRKGPAPPLPAGMIWVHFTETWWVKIWSSPMATKWTDFDVEPLVRLAKLQQDCLFGQDDRKLAEIRQLEDRFGLSPRGRRLLGWEIAPATDEDDELVDDDTVGDDASPGSSDDASPPGAGDASAPAKVIEIDPRRLRRASSA